MAHPDPPLRVAIVGAGPAGLYAAKELLADDRSTVRVSMLDAAPSPWGLVRTGVAPDHTSTQQVTRQFHRTLSDRRFNLFLNTRIGTHLSHDDLMAHHHAVLYAIGASEGRELTIPGEPLRGVHDAIDFVGWYNGALRHVDLEVDLSCEEAIVIGNGNVALDIARILTSAPEALEQTDICDHALASLRASRIRRVTILGRRGPQNAAFTTPELIGLMNSDVRLTSNASEFDLASADPVARFKMSLLKQIPTEPRSDDDTEIALRFGETTRMLFGDFAVHSAEVVDRDGVARLADVGLLIKSVGSRSVEVPGVPFDELNGVIPNDAGRVRAPDGTPLPGVYVAGWAKRGASGVIGTNRSCSSETVTHLLEDHQAGTLSDPSSGSEFAGFAARRNPHALSTIGWWRIDDREVEAGGHQRPRRKLTELAEFLAAGLPAGA